RVGGESPQSRWRTRPKGLDATSERLVATRSTPFSSRPPAPPRSSSPSRRESPSRSIQRGGATFRRRTRMGARYRGSGAPVSSRERPTRSLQPKRTPERSRATSKRPCPSLLPLDEQAEEANARRREDHVEDEHELEVVTELSKGGAREQIARRDDGRDEHRRQEGKENARQDEVAGSRAHRHGPEERAGSRDPPIRKHDHAGHRP